MPEENCKICKVEDSSPYVVYQTSFWRIRHIDETDIAGYCLLESKRHILDLSTAIDKELEQYGVILSKLMAAQRKLIPSCERIYTYSLAEAVPHFHVHVIPRRADFPAEYKGRGIMAYPLSPGLELDRVSEVVKDLQQLLV